MRDELRDPWGILVAVVLGGVAGAVAAAQGSSTVVTLLLGLAVAAAVFGVRFALVLPAGRYRRPRVPADAQPWLRRAETALAGFDAVRRLNRDPTLAVLLADAVREAGAAIRGLRERAAALAAVDDLNVGTDPRAADEEHARLAGEAAALPAGRLRDEKARAAEAAGNLADSYQRLASIRVQLLAAMEATVLRLEAAVARGRLVASMGAASHSTDPDTELTRLGIEIDAVRHGLDQTDQITRELLGSG